MKNDNNEYKYMPIGMCIGISIGMAIGAAVGKIAIGMCMGVSIGMCVGALIDSRLNKKQNDESSADESDKAHENEEK